jgi:hypothetical protein
MAYFGKEKYQIESVETDYAIMTIRVFDLQAGGVFKLVEEIYEIAELHFANNRSSYSSGKTDDEIAKQRKYNLWDTRRFIIDQFRDGPYDYQIKKDMSIRCHDYYLIGYCDNRYCDVNQNTDRADAKKKEINDAIAKVSRKAFIKPISNIVEGYAGL